MNNRFDTFNRLLQGATESSPPWLFLGVIQTWPKSRTGNFLAVA